MKTKITETGQGLVVKINCEELSKVYDWLSFATWYTCCKYLPDAKFSISLPKPSGNKEIVFTWLDRCKIKKINRDTPLTTPTLILKPQILQLRAFYPEELEQINSDSKIVGINCELFNDSKSVKKVNWLGAKTIAENPVFMATSEAIGEVDVRAWAAKSRDPIFSAIWTPKSPEEKLIQQSWHQMGMYYAMAIR